MYTERQRYHIWLHSMPGMTARLFRELVELASPEETIYQPGENTLQLMNPQMRASFQKCRQSGHIDAFLDNLEKRNISAVCEFDDDYPSELSDRLAYPPPVLYVRGRRDVGGVPSVAMVGTRRCTPEGKRTSRELSRELAIAGVCVISGFAYGVDSEAHRGALEGKGRTTAVLGCGVDYPYPADNQKLAAEVIANGGSLISEFLPGTSPLPTMFPIRNRIIAALSDAVVVVEAPARSGALNTANQALDMGINVYAVPGSIHNPICEGSNALLVSGAFPLIGARDLIDMQGWAEPDSENHADDDTSSAPTAALLPDERLVLNALTEQPLSFDLLSEITKLDSSRLNSLLTTLELRGIIEQSPSKLYTPCRKRA